MSKQDIKDKKDANTKKQEEKKKKKQLKIEAKTREKEIAAIKQIENRALRENWYKLDNAALIYPAIKSSDWNSVFRFSAEFKENIIVEKLQKAFDLTLKRFPIFNVCLRNGLFWHYFQPCVSKNLVEEEKAYPCRPFDINSRKALCRVLYYNKKISFESFHSLTDGYGASKFFNTMLVCYSELCGNKIPINQKNQLNLNVYDLFKEEEEGEDAFRRFASRDKTGSRKEHKAYAVVGNLEAPHILKIIKGVASVSKVKEVAKSFNATVNEFLSAVYINSILMQKKRSRVNKNPVKLSVPVNLRKRFTSETVRNFSAYYNLELPVDMENITFVDLINLVKQQKSEFDDEFLLKFLSSNVKSERNFFVRILPLVLKDFMLKIIYKFVGENLFTSTLTNLGVVSLPEALSKNLSSYYVCLGATKLNKFNLAVISHDDTMELCFSSRLKSTQIMQDFFSKLVDFGIDITVETNM